jgi:hypothetical protein
MDAPSAETTTATTGAIRRAAPRLAAHLAARRALRYGERNQRSGTRFSKPGASIARISGLGQSATAPKNPGVSWQAPGSPNAIRSVMTAVSGTVAIRMSRIHNSGRYHRGTSVVGLSPLANGSDAMLERLCRTSAVSIPVRVVGRGFRNANQGLELVGRSIRLSSGQKGRPSRIPNANRSMRGRPLRELPSRNLIQSSNGFGNLLCPRPGRHRGSFPTPPRSIRGDSGCSDGDSRVRRAPPAI